MVYILEKWQMEIFGERSLGKLRGNVLRQADQKMIKDKKLKQTNFLYPPGTRLQFQFRNSRTIWTVIKATKAPWESICLSATQVNGKMGMISLHYIRKGYYHRLEEWWFTASPRQHSEGIDMSLLNKQHNVVRFVLRKATNLVWTHRREMLFVAGEHCFQGRHGQFLEHSFSNLNINVPWYNGRTVSEAWKKYEKAMKSPSMRTRLQYFGLVVGWLSRKSIATCCSWFNFTSGTRFCWGTLELEGLVIWPEFDNRSIACEFSVLPTMMTACAVSITELFLTAFLIAGSGRDAFSKANETSMAPLPNWNDSSRKKQKKWSVLQIRSYCS